MDRLSRPRTARLRARAVSYKYRYCPRCRCEWPAADTSCRQCVHWLGDAPLQRTEWQLVPASSGPLAPEEHELVAAGAVVLRLICEEPPTEGELSTLSETINQIIAVQNCSVCEVEGHGWLVWTTKGLRQAFCHACEVERRLIASEARQQGVLLHRANMRWGIWVDQYVLPFSAQGGPVVDDMTAAAIFDFEPDNMALAAESVYQINRRWEHFVCVPRRLLDGQEPSGFRMMGHKRPSAMDHAEARELTPFVGRESQIAKIEDCWKRRGSTRLAVIAPAGSGKTRLIKEWLRRHADIRAITANFSLFGGGVEDFASQLAHLPPERLDPRALVEAVTARIRRENVKVVVLDDLHWAGPAGLAFIRALIVALPESVMLTILASRPVGRELVQELSPTVELNLAPLPPPIADELARRLVVSEKVASAAAQRSGGNPLFVEQFAAWAVETAFRGGEGGPRNLHQVIAARIDYLLKVRVGEIRTRLQWGGPSQRGLADEDLKRLESEIGLWLDRLETGDYADRIEVVQYLVQLERLEYEIFIISMVAGRARPRSSRLREAIERLLIGSADQVLIDLKRRAINAKATRQEILQAARRAGDVLAGAFNWALAADFYELALSIAGHESPEIAQQLSLCRRHSRGVIATDGEVYSAYEAKRLLERPSVTARDLPYVWAELGRRFARRAYFLRAGEAAGAINDDALAAWAKRKATELAVKESRPPVD